jgi:hypothetical protein
MNDGIENIAVIDNGLCFFWLDSDGGTSGEVVDASLL